MHILIACPKYKAIGGIAQHVRSQVRYLRNKGHHVDIITNIDQPYLPIPKLRRISAMCALCIRAWCAGRYDVVHAHHHYSAFALIGARGSYKVLSIHGRYLPQTELINGRLLKWFARWYERRALSMPDIVTVVDSNTMQYYQNMTDLPIYRISNGIDITALPSNSYKRFEKQIIYAGRLSVEKGIRELLKAAESLPRDVHLVIVGAGSQESKVRVAAEQPNIHYMGLQSHEDTVRWIRGSDVLIEPSIFANGFPSTTIEAMACNTIVVAHNIPAYREFMNDGTAVLFDNHSDIARIVNDLLDDDARRAKIANQAFEKAQSYDFTVIGKQYLDLYDQIKNNHL